MFTNIGWSILAGTHVFIAEKLVKVAMDLNYRGVFVTGSSPQGFIILNGE